MTRINEPSLDPDAAAQVPPYLTDESRTNGNIQTVDNITEVGDSHTRPKRNRNLRQQAGKTPLDHTCADQHDSASWKLVLKTQEEEDLEQVGLCDAEERQLRETPSLPPSVTPAPESAEEEAAVRRFTLNTGVLAPHQEFLKASTL